jgi:hypothetical protein
MAKKVAAGAASRAEVAQWLWTGPRDKRYARELLSALSRSLEPGQQRKPRKEVHALRENEERFRKTVRVGVQLATGGRAPLVFARD